MIKRYFILALILSLFSLTVPAQELSNQEISDYKSECYDLVGYLEFSLNSIGGNDLSPKEKDIIISKSFTKLFRDAKVQVEDDLIPNREAITNKDIQAYLKDVDFFFKDVNFSFKILTIDLLQNEVNHAFFKIQAIRTLTGHNIQNDSIYNEQVRFIEVAIDQNQRDLKIVSIYTTKINHAEENINWWNELPLNWKEILGKNQYLSNGTEFSSILNIQADMFIIEKQNDSLNLTINDSINLTNALIFDSIIISKDSIGDALYKDINHQLNNILNITKLDISSKYDITSLEPLSKLTELHTLDVSYTMINDLYPIRNLVNLQDLNISNTPVNNLDALIYSMSLQKLNISHTQVYSLNAIVNLSNLKIINISSTYIDDIRPLTQMTAISNLDMNNNPGINDIESLAELKELTYLDISNCPIDDISSLSNLNHLSIFRCNNTMTNDLSPLSNLNKLTIVHCENTEITNLDALNDMTDLAKIYCDNTLLNEEKAVEFMNKNPHVLVVYETKKLKKWFSSLSQEWKEIFASNVDIDISNPSKEDLHQVISILELDISDHEKITSLEPISRLKNIKTLKAPHTNITSINALYELRELDYLDMSHTNIENISALENLSGISYIDISNTQISNIEVFKNIHNLKYINIDSTPITSLKPIFNSSAIRKINANNTNIDNSEFEAFLLKNPKCVVIYQSEELLNWWNGLNDGWTEVLSNIMDWEASPDDIELHQLVKSSTLTIKNNREIDDLMPMMAFTLIKELHITGTQISNIDFLADLKHLKSINLSNNPIMSMDALSNADQLTSINISNTPINNLDWIVNMSQLEYLDISGTQIRKTKPLESLGHLKTLIAYNTRISRLSDLDNAINLRNLKIYNTKVSARKVEDFKSTHPNCTVDYY